MNRFYAGSVFLLVSVFATLAVADPVNYKALDPSISNFQTNTVAITKAVDACLVPAIGAFFGHFAESPFGIFSVAFDTGFGTTFFGPNGGWGIAWTGSDDGTGSTSPAADATVLISPSTNAPVSPLQILGYQVSVNASQYGQFESLPSHSFPVVVASSSPKESYDDFGNAIPSAEIYSNVQILVDSQFDANKSNLISLQNYQTQQMTTRQFDEGSYVDCLQKQIGLK